MLKGLHGDLGFSFTRGRYSIELKQTVNCVKQTGMVLISWQA